LNPNIDKNIDFDPLRERTCNTHGKGEEELVQVKSKLCLFG